MFETPTGTTEVSSYLTVNVSGPTPAPTAVSNLTFALALLFAATLAVPIMLGKREG